MPTPYRILLWRFAARRARMRALRESGWTLAQIAARYKISRQRVGQMLRDDK